MAPQKSASVDYVKLQTVVIGCLQFSAVCRADELIALRKEDKFFSIDTAESPIGAVAQIMTTIQTSETYLVFKKATVARFVQLKSYLYGCLFYKNMKLLKVLYLFLCTITDFREIECFDIKATLRPKSNFSRL